MNINELRLHASRAVIDLGPEPVDPVDYALWVEQRGGAAVLLATLADNDCDMLRRTAIGEWVPTAARDLLLASMSECQVREQTGTPNSLADR